MAVFPQSCAPLSLGSILSPGVVCAFGFYSILASTGFSPGSPVKCHCISGNVFGLTTLVPIGSWYSTAPLVPYIPWKICRTLQKFIFIIHFLNNHFNHTHRPWIVTVAISFNFETCWSKYTDCNKKNYTLRKSYFWNILQDKLNIIISY